MSQALAAIANGSHAFAKVLTDAKRPMIVLGSGVLTRTDGAAILSLAAQHCRRHRHDRPRRHPCRRRLERLQHPAHRGQPRGGAGPGLPARRKDGRDVAGIVDGAQKGEIDFIYLLGADEFDVAHLGRAFVVYQGSHGDAGAHHADVVLPGAAYTEKDGLYVNFEGRVQRAAAPPSRRARPRKTGPSCAHCPMCWA